MSVYFTNPSVNPTLMLLVLFVYGTGYGSVLPLLLSAALKSMPSQFAEAAAGTFSTFQQAAIPLGIGVVGGIFFIWRI